MIQTRGAEGAAVKERHDRRAGGHGHRGNQGGEHDHQKKHRKRKHSQWGDVWFRLRRNKLAMLGMIMALILVLVSIFAHVLTPYEFDAQSISERMQMPSVKHLLGTDNFGRDLLTRLLYGGRTSLLVASLALVFSTLVAIVLGALAGFYGGWIETVIMRVTDVIMAIPSMLFAVSISAALGSGIWQTAVAIGITGIAPNVRLLRGQILAVRGQEYVEAAIATGSNNARVMFKQILPNCLSPIIVQASMGIGGNITAISGLSFIGLGVQPPIAEWGNIMTTGLSYIRQFWPIAIFPGIMIMLTLFAFNCFGDGLRDALDPKLKQ